MRCSLVEYSLQYLCNTSRQQNRHFLTYIYTRLEVETKLSEKSHYRPELKLNSNLKNTFIQHIFLPAEVCTVNE